VSHVVEFPNQARHQRFESRSSLSLSTSFSAASYIRQNGNIPRYWRRPSGTSDFYTSPIFQSFVHLTVTIVALSNKPVAEYDHPSTQFASCSPVIVTTDTKLRCCKTILTGRASVKDLESISASFSSAPFSEASSSNPPQTRTLFRVPTTSRCTKQASSDYHPGGHSIPVGIRSLACISDSPGEIVLPSLEKPSYYLDARC